MTLARCNYSLFLVLLLTLSSCASYPPKEKEGSASKVDGKSSTQECQRAVNDAIRLRNSAVSAQNSGRSDAALTLFDQSLDMWRQITTGALSCSRDTLTYANEHLDQTLRERDDIARSAR